MKRLFLLLTTAIVVLGMSNCSKSNNATQVIPAVTSAQHHNEERAVYTGWPETFESGTKASYTDGTVTLSTGIWDLNDALIGNLSTDRKDGTKSVRIENTGKVTMNFNVTNGASQVTIAHGVYGTDASSTWQLWYSTNSGSTWTQTGGTTTTSSTTLSTATYTMSVSGNVRFQVRKLTGGRLNIDDFNITDNSGTGGGTGSDTVATRDDNMAMGNPSGATTNVSVPNNYLMVKPQYTLSYNNSKGEANWVSWHLSSAWLGSTDRCNCFTSDASLPASFFHATTSNYTSTGFDRGHLCPSGDRTYSDTDNARTFLMTNMTPQAPNMNEVTWEAFEDYCRTLATSGNELYIIAGWSGQGGTGSSGGTTNTIASGAINVPAYFWKIAVVLPVGTNDVSRVTTSTRVIAVKMPNIQTVNAHTWDYYRTSVDAIESLTGYDFLSNVPVSIQAVIEARIDSGPTE